MRNLKAYYFLPGILFILIFGILCMPVKVNAGVVEPSGGRSDIYEIVSELENTGSVTLKSGCTYYLPYKITPHNGWTINAYGAKIILGSDLFVNNITTTNYNSLNGFTVKGGTWVSEDSSGIGHSLIKMAHAQNIKFIDMKIEAANVENHTIELIACKNVTISGCNIKGIGTPGSTSVEEAIQIDVATPPTAPYISDPNRYCNGAGCKNITIQNCKVSGGRAVCANYLSRTESQYNKYKKAKNFHSNIKVKGCTLTGLTSEGLALFNTLNATVSKCTIKSKSKRTGVAYSVGCHFAIFYPASKAAINKGKILVSGNKIYGGRQALYVDAHKASYGKVTVKNNKLYCKNGAKKAFQKSSVKTLKVSNNTMKKW